MSQHQDEMLLNLRRWERKPVLHRIYRDFHRTIAGCIAPEVEGDILEIGSGIGSIREVIPRCIRTDLLPSPWIDRVENAYALTAPAGSVSNLILFDVFHHLRYPGSALAEFRRVLAPRGRLIIFDPCISLLGLLVYGLAHHEPVALLRPIVWQAPDGWNGKDDYYAAAGNATRLFGLSKYRSRLSDWELLHVRKLAALSYVASGGYSGPQLYPDRWLPWMRRLDALLDRCPALFATRLVVVLAKPDGSI